MTLPPILRAAIGPGRIMLPDRLAVIGLCVWNVIIAMALFAPLLVMGDEVLALRPRLPAEPARFAEEGGALRLRLAPRPSPRRRRIAKGHELACVLDPE